MLKIENIIAEYLHNYENPQRVALSKKISFIQENNYFLSSGQEKYSKSFRF
jgi:hypothetical protein